MLNNIYHELSNQFSLSPGKNKSKNKKSKGKNNNDSDRSKSKNHSNHSDSSSNRSKIADSSRSTDSKMDNDATMSNSGSNGTGKEDQVASLQEQVTMLKSALEEQQQRLMIEEAKNYHSNERKQYHKKHKSKKHHASHFSPLSPYATHVKEVVMNAKGKTTLSTQRLRMGRSASICTQQVLDSIPDDAHGGAGYTPGYMQRVLNMFQNPTTHLDYLSSTLFGKDVYKLASKVRTVLEKEPRVVFVQSPVYVFGDIHGNIEDLHFFSDNVWRLGMNLTAGNFLFLGDYVDRGLHCLECLAYLFMMKLQLPNKVFLLRGNHETRDVNGWEEHYADRSFLYQCRARFGDDIGYRIWEICNQAFDRLPLAAVIDQDIFCVHGGIPRPIALGIGGIGFGLNSPAMNNGGLMGTPNAPTSSNSNAVLASRVQDILAVSKVAGINPPYEHEDEIYQQVASDCIWSDPASEEQEMTTVDPDTGFGESLRGGGAICFGSKAVTNFMQQENLSFIMRAHEAHAEGVAVCKGARVFTVFSTSKDHNQGDKAMAGCMLVDNDKLQVINRSPAYKNQYVHRRDSVSVAMLSDAELQKRMQLGLVTDVYDEDEDDMEDYSSDEDSSDDEQWENFDDTGVADEGQQSESEVDVSATDGVKVSGASSPGGSVGGNDAVGMSSSHHSTGHRGKDGEVYVIAQNRRSSVDLNSLSDYSYASSEYEHTEKENQEGGGAAMPNFTGYSLEQNNNKRPRPRKQLSVASIYEGEKEDEEDEDEEIETVDGGEQQMQT